MKTSILIISFLFLTGCSKSEIVYLEKYNMFGEWERTSVMFGYYNNYDACMEINTALTDKYLGNVYRCTPNNNSFVSLMLNAVKN